MPAFNLSEIIEEKNEHIEIKYFDYAGIFSSNANKIMFLTSIFTSWIKVTVFIVIQNKR